MITPHNPPNVPEYATPCIWNCNNSRMLLLASHPGSTLDYFILCDGDGTFIADLPISANDEPRWDLTGSRLLYCISGNSLLSLHLDGDPRVWETFAEYASISGRGKSDISADGDHFVLKGTKKDGSAEIFVYSLKNGKGPTFPPLPDLNSLYITKSNYVIQGTLNGCFLFEQDGTPHGMILPGQVPHMDVWEDSLVFCSSNVNAINKNAVAMIDVLKPNDVKILLDLPQNKWAYAFHISCGPFPIVSTYTSDNSMPMQIWKAFYEGQPAKLLVADTGGIMRADPNTHYQSQPHATVSRDGSRIAYAVDNGTTIRTEILYTESAPVVDPVESWIDYRQFQDQEFIFRPTPDGLLKVFSRKRTDR